MLAVVVVYLGLVTILLGVISVVKPFSWLGISSRRGAACMLALGVVVAITGCVLPAREARVALPRTHLDEFAPAYQFNEVHSIAIAASSSAGSQRRPDFT